MGYLLKEALKTLCGVNQWAYAVFWKIGCQNPKLLIWEECYYESASCSGFSANPEIALQGFNEGFNLQSGVRAQDKVDLLVNKMMVDNHFNIVGEGLVGRVAFTGNHQWILPENYFQEEHPPEVLKEVCLQFAAGMQTVAVIPALPHGVVQFGSFSRIMENPGFVKDVTSIVLELGYVSGAMLSSEDFAAKEHDANIEVPVCLRSSTPNMIDLPFSFINFNYIGNSSQASMVNSQTWFPSAGDIQNGKQLSSMPILNTNTALSDTSMPRQCHYNAKIAQPVKLHFSASNQLMSAVVRAEVIPSNSEMGMNQQASAYMQTPPLDGPSSSSSLHTEDKIFPDAGISGHSNNLNVPASIEMVAVRANSGSMHCSSGDSATHAMAEARGLYKDPPNDMKQVSGMDSFSEVNWVSNGSVAPKHLTGELKLTKMGGELNICKKEMDQNTRQACDVPRSQYEHISSGEFAPGFVKDDRKRKFGDHSSSVNNAKCDDLYVQPESGDDLFDVLGADFKNKLFSHSWNGYSSNSSTPIMHHLERSNLPSESLVCSEIYNLPSESVVGPEMYCTSQGNLDSAIFTSSGTDSLLEAVVTKVPSNTDDNVSCGTTLTSNNRASLPYGRFGGSDHMKGELFSIPKYPAKAGETSSCSLITGASKEESVSHSRGSSIYGSQISLWIQKNQKAKSSNSVSTGYSKKPETSKTTRRRLKPGENPRPRPKDRQMIQDRVKELREIVPNGAKCSIDSLLERTIKHMLFLQSVTKHADKLKQTDESKIISKDGGLLLKDNFEGGATWAYEVGSQSMVCPIIVEDLNQSRQMLVEMLCEERGLFLEIADMIRGLGLTILKGVMETRNDKIWARFAVEANRDVTRMEIFISLVRLLEQSSKSSTAQQNAAAVKENHSIAAHQYLQATSIPVPGGSQ